jgi:ribosomal protein L17
MSILKQHEITMTKEKHNALRKRIERLLQLEQTDENQSLIASLQWRLREYADKLREHGK